MEYHTWQCYLLIYVVYTFWCFTNLIFLKQDDGGLFNEEGMPKKRVPSHWKGENGLYCAGFSRSGLFGISNDAKSIAQDICVAFGQKKL